MKPSSHQQNQQRLNAATRANWELFQTHREHLGKLLIESCGSRFKSLCVLGAGNTNDLDLPPLTAQFQRTLLLDLDLAAMQHGVRQQFGENTPNSLEIRHAEVTGSLEVMNELLSEPTKEPLLQQLTERLSQPRLPITIGEQFDCVVSSCLLSQLIES